MQRRGFSIQVIGPLLATVAIVLPANGALAQVAVEDEWLSDVTLDWRDSDAETLDKGDGHFVGAINITGSQSFKTEDFDDIIAPYLGGDLTEDDLRKLTQEIAQDARDNGFVFASARIPQQSLNQGILHIELNEGRIDEVRIIGSDNTALAATLNALTGRFAHKKEVERAVLLAGDIPDIRVQKSRFVQEDGRNILEVTVSERGDKLNISADNYGSQRLGPLRLRTTYQANAVLFGGDTATLSARTNPVDPKEFVYASAGYETGIGHNGTRLGLSGTVGNTRPGPGSSGLSDIEGDSRFISAELSHPVVRTDRGSLWINAGAAYLTIEQDSLGALLVADTQVTFTLGVTGNQKVAGGRFRGGVTVTRGAGVLGTTRNGDNRKSRFDGDGVFTKASAFVSWSGALWGDLGLSLSGFGQWADRPLLASQEISIGGAFSARGFKFSEVSGENGAYGTMELNYSFKKPTPWLKQLQPYVFVDGGYADNIGTGGGGGSLLSSGMGLRARIGDISVEVEGAAPLNRPRYATGDKSPQVNLWLGMDI